MAANNIQETEELIVKLLKKLERKGKNIQVFLFKLMDFFEDEEYDEKNNENTKNINNNQITLLYQPTSKLVCKIGHYISPKEYKHLALQACIICHHKNNNNVQNFTKPTENEIIMFLEQYNTQNIAFGPHKNQIELFQNGIQQQWSLRHAAITGDIEQIKKLCNKKSITIAEKTENLTTACSYGQLQSVIELIKLGGNATPPPDTANNTPYKCAIQFNHNAVIVFFQKYIQFLYGFSINENINVQCHNCYNYDSEFNPNGIKTGMKHYTYCKNCAVDNVKNVNLVQENNKIIEKRIIKTMKMNSSISTDFLCEMKNVVSLHSILKEILIFGQRHQFSLWLIDMDYFKKINEALTHVIADTKIQALGQILKALEQPSAEQWTDNGYDGVIMIRAFRQGGDEFALVVWSLLSKITVLQKVYDKLRDDINNIKLGKTVEINENKRMDNVTVSIGVCLCMGAFDSYEEWMRMTDKKACEEVKKNGKDGIMIYWPEYDYTCDNFMEI